MSTIDDRVNALVALGDFIRKETDEWKSVKEKAEAYNPWFTPREIDRSVNAIADTFLSKDKLEEWTQRYMLSDISNLKKVGLILAGNIPMVGWHDLQCVYLAGHQGLVKYSSKDEILIPYLVSKLADFDPDVTSQLQKVDQLKGFDAVIATGSNNTGRYFNEYFSKVPNIIRQHRNSVAVLSGKESREELLDLGKDIFSYFGLGCRNVTHLYLPEGYDPGELLDIWDEEFSIVSEHNKYRNNYEYNYAIWLLNKEDFKAGQTILMKEDSSYLARIGSVNYSYYTDLSELEKELTDREKEIQCIVSSAPVGAHAITPPGDAQRPAWDDYADNIDTMEFLLNNQ